MRRGRRRNLSINTYYIVALVAIVVAEQEIKISSSSLPRLKTVERLFARNPSRRREKERERERGGERVREARLAATKLSRPHIEVFSGEIFSRVVCIALFFFCFFIFSILLLLLLLLLETGALLISMKRRFL